MRMNSTRSWKHSFQTLGFAFTIIGAILTMIGFIALNTSTNCPASGCPYNPALAIAGSGFPSGATLIIAGIVVIWMVKIESDKEERRSS